MSAATPWPAILDGELVERMIPAIQRAIVAATVGSDAEPTGDAPVQLNLPDTANVLLMVLATVLEPAPDCATPRGTRLLAEAAGKELALLIRDTRALKAAQEAETGSAH